MYLNRPTRSKGVICPFIPVIFFLFAVFIFIPHADVSYNLVNIPSTMPGQGILNCTVKARHHLKGPTSSPAAHPRPLASRCGREPQPPINLPSHCPAYQASRPGNPLPDHRKLPLFQSGGVVLRCLSRQSPQPAWPGCLFSAPFQSRPPHKGNLDSLVLVRGSQPDQAETNFIANILNFRITSDNGSVMFQCRPDGKGVRIR